MLGELVCRQARQQRAADAQVDSGTVRFGNQRISGLLDPVVQELAAAAGAHDQTFAHRRREALSTSASLRRSRAWPLNAR